MKLENLLANLNNSDPAIRIDVTRVLGMVDETLALMAIGQHYKTETEPAVRQALDWAGKRLYAAHQAGYNTVDEICRQFGVDNEIAHAEDPEEAKLLKKMQDEFERDMLRMKEQGASKKAGMAAAAGIAGAMMGGMSMGMGMMGSALKPGAEAASSNLGGSRPQIGTQRTPAAMPSKVNISIWVRRLSEESSAADRAKAVIELGSLNNPAALPHLAAAFASDPSPKVQEAAQRAGKLLYWRTVYWHMEQDGSLAAEMQRRAEAMGKTVRAKASTEPAPTSPESPSSAQPEDVSAILRRANASRKRRKKP